MVCRSNTQCACTNCGNNTGTYLCYHAVVIKPLKITPTHKSSVRIRGVTYDCTHRQSLVAWRDGVFGAVPENFWWRGSARQRQ